MTHFAILRLLSSVLVALMIAGCAGATAAPPSGAGPSASGGQPATAPAGEAGASAQRATLKVAYVPVLAFGPLYRAVAKG